MTPPVPGAAADSAPGAAADEELRGQAQDWLARIAGPQAVLRGDQWTAIEHLLAGRRVLNVQRTGWGKSAVYWVATALLRARGAGPCLVVSPLLALMRDQVAAAQRAGLRAATLNSANLDEWDQIEAELLGGQIDVLLVSPERLNSMGFRSRVLPGLGQRIGLLVIDEAHSISDWGSDFRPDYLRLRALIGDLRPGTPVLGTTATANQRVCLDVAAQMGDALVLRGPLDRASLALSVVPTASLAHAYAWISGALQHQDGSGIIYTLTVAETGKLADFLRSQGHDVAAYSSATDVEERHALEGRLRANAVKALVATSSLGMGFDKGDLTFVINLGAPSSPLAYYQQVGRAGRAVSDAVGVLLPTAADPAIWAYFVSTAMPPERVVRRVIAALDDAAGPLSVIALETATDVRRGRLETLLKILDVDGAVRREGTGYMSTSVPWHYDADRYAAIAAARQQEQQAMLRYLAGGTCLMESLRSALDDPAAQPCGRCSVCTGQLPPPGAEPDPEVLAAALGQLRSVDAVLEPRRMWPAGATAGGRENPAAPARRGTPSEPGRGGTPPMPGRRGKIPEPSRAEPGRALAFAQDPGWGEAVQRALAVDGPVDQEVFDGCVRVLARWGWPAGRPVSVVPMPSRRRGLLVADLAERLAAVGRLEVAPVLGQVDDETFQDDAQTGRGSAEGALRRLSVIAPVPAGPVLLVDDVSRSGFTLTVAAALLREAGAGPVYPLVLHKRP